jgi:hypothetical protein
LVRRHTPSDLSDLSDLDAADRAIMEFMLTQSDDNAESRLAVCPPFPFHCVAGLV